MGIKQQKVDVNELVVGMYVSGLDRPWTQTPFPLQGFYIRDLDEIRELKVHCRHVYIDVSKSPTPTKTSLKVMAPKATTKASRASVAKLLVTRSLAGSAAGCRKSC